MSAARQKLAACTACHCTFCSNQLPLSATPTLDAFGAAPSGPLSHAVVETGKTGGSVGVIVFGVGLACKSAPLGQVAGVKERLAGWRHAAGARAAARVLLGQLTAPLRPLRSPRCGSDPPPPPPPPPPAQVTPPPPPPHPTQQNSGLSANAPPFISTARPQQAAHSAAVVLVVLASRTQARASTMLRSRGGKSCLASPTRTLTSETKHSSNSEATRE